MPNARLTVLSIVPMNNAENVTILLVQTFNAAEVHLLQGEAVVGVISITSAALEVATMSDRRLANLAAAYAA